MLYLGKTIRYVRERKKLTTRAMASDLDVSHVHITKLENSQVAPSIAFLDKFKEAYGIDVPVLAWCLYGDPEKLPSSLRKPMRALASAWRAELGDLAEGAA